ncbi:unnamed protein product [Ascophyllum nodosum]
MGQKVGKARFDDRAKPFVNLPRDAIGALWQEFNLCAENWGIDLTFFGELCQAMARSMDTEFNEESNKALFSAFDTDKNGLVDGLEFMSTLGMVSGMTREDKIEFVFTCYDVGGRSNLSMDELFLLLKSTATGLCKLSGIDAPDSARLEATAGLVFTHSKTSSECGLSLGALSRYFDENPVAGSWLSFYDDWNVQGLGELAKEEDTLARLEDIAPDIHHEESLFAPRSKVQEDANIGVDQGIPTVGPVGAWVEAAKELVPLPPRGTLLNIFKEEDEEAEDNDDDEETTPPVGENTKIEEPPLPPPAPPAPDTQLSLEWVYGYSAAACRGSVRYTASGAVSSKDGVVYPAGKVAVVLFQPLDEDGAELEAGDRVQSFMQEHTDEITALAVSPCGKWVATGETGANPKVIVWNAATKQIRYTNTGFHTMGIAYLAWSPGGNMLASVGADELHSLEIVEASSSPAAPLFRVRTGLSRPLGIAWTGDNISLVTCGQIGKGIPPLVFWVKNSSTRSFDKKRGIPAAGKLKPSSDIQVVICAVPSIKKGLLSSSTTSPVCMVSGTINGGLCLWRGRNCCKAVEDAHSGTVEALSAVNTRGGIVASGGRDPKVKLWSSEDLVLQAELDIIATPSVSGLRQVRSVCLSSDGVKVLVGTLGSDILELAAVEKQKGAAGEDDEEEEEQEEEQEEARGEKSRAKPSGIGRVLNGGQPLVCGHCVRQEKGVDGQLRAVDVSPQGDQFVTVGDDGTVRMWSNGDKKLARALNLGCPALSVSYAPDASLVAVGLAGGGVLVVKPSEEVASDLVLEKSIDAFQASTSGASCVRFNPSGGTLFAGSDKGSLKAWGTADRDWEEAGSVENLVSGSVLSMDFTVDGMFVMLNSSGMDMVIVNVETCERASSENMKTLRGEGNDGEVAVWATSTCTMTDGKQAAWATMVSMHINAPSPFHLSEKPSPTGDCSTLTASDLVKDGESYILLASDSLGRIGLFHYPAPFPEYPTVIPSKGGAESEVQNIVEVDREGKEGEELSREEDNSPAELAAKRSRAMDAAIPRVSMIKAHAGKVAAVRQLGEGGGIVTLGASDRCVYQWAVELDEGMESGEEEPDPPACNAPAPKPPVIREGGGDNDEENEDDEDADQPTAEAWSGDDEDLIDSSTKVPDQPCPGPDGGTGSQEMSTILALQASAQSGPPTALPWIEGNESDFFHTPCVPDHDLQLEWIHGYSAQGSRQNLFYNCKGEIVYPAACVGVVMTKATKPKHHETKFHLEHTEAITCLTVHPDRDHIATGQEGPSPIVLVWSSASKSTPTRARLQLGGDKTGVSQVCFSPDGKLLAAACEDKSHTVMVFRWKEGLLRCQSRLGAKKALALCFGLNGQSLLAAGHKHFKVWTLSGGGAMQGKRGLFGSGSKVQALMCATAMLNEEGESSFVLGGSSGNLLKLEGRKVSLETEAHKGAIYGLYAYPSPDGSGTCLITGGADGKVKMWDAEMGMVNEFELAGRSYMLGAVPCVRSVCLNDHSDSRKILVGTSCSEIIEISTTEGTDVNGGDCLIRGHFRDQLWGLAAHPAKAEYSSSGDDGMLKEWDAITFTLKRQIDLGGFIRSLVYSPNGLLVACGMGGETDGLSPYGERNKRHSPREEDGAVKIVSGMESDFRVVNTLLDAKGPISCVRFSPDGYRMVAASLDGNLYIYCVRKNFKLERIVEGNQGGILRIDFSSDDLWIRAEARGKREAPDEASTIAVVLVSAESGDICDDKKVVDPETGFATWSGLRSDHVAGLWPLGATSPQDITCTTRSHEGGLLATSDTHGYIKLFSRYPAKGRAASFKTFKAHAPGARSVCFLGKGNSSQCLLSVGGKDRCVMQWRILHPDPSVGTTVEKASAIASAEKDVTLKAELAALAVLGRQPDTVPIFPRPWESGHGLTGPAPPSNASAPSGVMLELEFVHGYNSVGQARNNLGFSSSDKIVLPCASVGVVFDKTSHSQVIFDSHSGRILSLAVSICGRFVATGQEGSIASTMIWDPSTGHEICALPPSLSGAVRRLSFSPDGQSLCGIGADRDSSLCIWRSASGKWSDGTRIALGQGPRRPALFVAWARGGDSAPYQVMTGGQEYILFWTLRPNLCSRVGQKRPQSSAPAESSELNPASNEAETHSSPFSTAETVMEETFTCGVAIGLQSCPSIAVTGTASGAFVVWENFERARVIPGTHGPSAVLCLSATHSGGFASGGADGVARIWDEHLNLKGEPICVSHICSSKGGSRATIGAIAVNTKESNMAVGTGDGRVIEVSLDSGDTSVLIEGHAATQAASEDNYSATPNRCAVAVSPQNRNVFVTAGRDGFLRKWCTDKRRLLAKLALGATDAAVHSSAWEAKGLPGIGSLEWAPGGTFIACGLSSGDVVLVSPGDMTVLSRLARGKKPPSGITAIAMSPDEKTMTVGCENGSLHGLNIRQEGAGVQFAWSNESTGAAVLAMDMSSDGQTIRYSDASGTLSFVSSSGTALKDAPSGHDADTWATSKCFFGHWGVRATSDIERRDGEATASARSHAKDILAATSDCASLGLWHYPAAQNGAACVRGHGGMLSAPVALAFTNDDSKIIAVGGADNSVLQWSVEHS